MAIVDRRRSAVVDDMGELLSPMRRTGVQCSDLQRRIAHSTQDFQIHCINPSIPAQVGRILHRFHPRSGLPNPELAQLKRPWPDGNTASCACRKSARAKHLASPRVAPFLQAHVDHRRRYDDRLMGTEVLRFLLGWMAGWINQRQLEVIDYLREENRVPREQLRVEHRAGGRRLRFTDGRGCGTVEPQTMPVIGIWACAREELRAS